MVLEKTSETNVRLGKGQKHGQKKESIVTSVYTIESVPRTAHGVVASFFNLPVEAEASKIVHSKPVNKQIRATLDGKDTALSRLSTQVTKYDGSHISTELPYAMGVKLYRHA